jgi:uncharacterized protein YdeI (BOF family)
MKKSILSLGSMGALAVILAVITSGILSQAQQTQSPPDQAAPPSQRGQQPPPGQAAPPDSEAQSQAASTQTFSGTVVKAGDKYVLKDESSGTAYDIDRQDLVKKYEGQKVRIHGTLDSSGKMIQVQ